MKPKSNDKFVWAPFTEDQVASINAYQASNVGHPFTCGSNRHKEQALLIAQVNGWYCPLCDYGQSWAWNWMADWSWEKLRLV
ncbi:MAG TPA: hypothetical protein VIY48_00890 [Candidatus Paceibacterota bacterium]